MNTTRQLSNIMCNRLGLETLGYQPIMPKNSLDTGVNVVDPHIIALRQQCCMTD